MTNISAPDLFISFVVTWLLGLSPALLMRYVIARQPIPRRHANWVAGISSGLFWFLFRALGSSTNGAVWILVFIASRQIMMMIPKHRREMIARLQEIASDPDAPFEQKQAALERMALLKRDTRANTGIS